MTWQGSLQIGLLQRHHLWQNLRDLFGQTVVKSFWCPPLPSTKFQLAQKISLNTSLNRNTLFVALHPDFCTSNIKKSPVLTGFSICPYLGGFEHHFWGLKMTVIYLVLRCLRGIYSKPCLNPPKKFSSWTIPTERAWRRKVKSWSNAQRTVHQPDFSGMLRYFWWKPESWDSGLCVSWWTNEQPGMIIFHTI